MSKHLLRVNLVLLVAFAAVSGASKIAGVGAERELYLHVALFGVPFLAFGVVQLGCSVLIGSLPTRRIGAGIFAGTLLIASYALWVAHAWPLAAASLLLLIMPATVLLTTPRVELVPLSPVRSGSDISGLG